MSTMDAALPLRSFCAVVIVLCVAASDHQYNRRYEYKYSFKGPNLVVKNGIVPFWDVGGGLFSFPDQEEFCRVDAIASDESIRVTPSLKSKKGCSRVDFVTPHMHGLELCNGAVHVFQGFAYTVNATSFDKWEVDVALRVSGRGRVGADGMALWYTASKPQVAGAVFGGPDRWNGLAIIMDSFDNDGQRNNPYIMAVVNDGTMSFDHLNDGGSQQLGGCLRDFRNKPFPVKLRISYLNQQLTIFYHSGLTQATNAQYELCMRADNVILPAFGHFGVTAATGGLADDHDVLSFETHSFSLIGATPTEDAAREADRKRYEKEFDEYMEQLKVAQNKYAEEHKDDPNTVKEDSDFFEDREQRQLRQILNAHEQQQKTLSDISAVLENVARKQDVSIGDVRTMQQHVGGVLHHLQSGSASPPPGGAPPSQVASIPSPIQRHEVDELLRTQRDIHASLSSISSIVQELRNRPAVANPSGGGGAPFGASADTHEIKDGVNTLRGDLRSVLVKIDECNENIVRSAGGSDSTCLSRWFYIVMTCLQASVFITWFFYKRHQERSVKKLY